MTRIEFAYPFPCVVGLFRLISYEVEQDIASAAYEDASRLVDMFIREHILLLWIIEGNEFMRVHGGSHAFGYSFVLL
jgi:hypothetical protein